MSKLRKGAIFQSTPSVWRETEARQHLSDDFLFQSTPSVWRETGRSMTRRPYGAFQSTPSVWRETDRIRRNSDHYRFQSTPSVWRETRCSLPPFQTIADFNPLPPCGGRRSSKTIMPDASHFNPLPPCGGRPERPSMPSCRQSISIHSLRVEGDGDAMTPQQIQKISIHSLRVEGDCSGSISLPYVWYFNPLPPCGGRRK